VGFWAVVAEVLAKIARKLVGESGMTLVEATRTVGVSTTAILKIIGGGRKLN